MWYLLLALTLLVAVTAVIWWPRERHYGDDPILATLMLWTFGALILAGIGYPTLRLSTGFWEGYATGERDGYVTKFSRKGAIFKTWEAQLQIGTGAQAALQEPWSFSVPDEYADEVQAALGSHVRIEYTQFLLMPWRLGETDYLVTGIEPIQ